MKTAPASNVAWATRPWSFLFKLHHGRVARAANCCAAAILACFLVGCQQHPPADTRTALGHVVVFWLKTPGDSQARQRIIAAGDGFRAIPGVLKVDAGAMVPTPRPNVDKSYDVAVVIWFKDSSALEQYQVHPKHKAMLAELGPLIDHTVAYDFTRPVAP